VKKLKFLLALLPAVLILALPLKSSAQNVQDFTIKSFSADYYLDRNSAKTSTLKTIETITAQFPNFDQNHGILRAIPKEFQGHTTSLKFDSVTDGNGQPWQYTKYGQNGNLVLKIGDKNVFVHGLQTYVITYEQRNVTQAVSGGDQFYWNVNGSQWDQPFGSITARLHLPPSLAVNSEEGDCYVGYSGSIDQSRCAKSSLNDTGGTVDVFSADNLAAGEVMSFKVDFLGGTFVPGPEIAHEQKVFKYAVAGALAAVLLPPAIAFGGMFRRWRKFGDDPKGRGVIIPQYDPPKGLTPLYSDFILNEKLRGKAFAAMLIDLAVHKVLTISEIGKKGIFGHKDYELEINSLPADLNADTLQALSIIFAGSPAPEKAVKMSDLQKRAKASTAVHDQMKSLEQAIATRLFTLGYFIKDPLVIKKSYRLWALLPVAIGFGLMWSVGHIINDDSAISVILVIASGLGLMLVGGVMFLFSFIMPARSLSGVEARDELSGLKDYIALAEADRLRYLQSPEGAEKIADQSAFNPQDTVLKVKLFETLLPYAMLFGQEKQWAKQFKDIYTQPPDWYRGNWATFNSVYLADSLGGFSGSSALSFSSPSSGGGGAGGGGGGGGGGGW
jgi:hypothetical protein